MKPDNELKAIIAETCGYEKHEYGQPFAKYYVFVKQGGVTPIHYFLHELPDWPNSLDAIRKEVLAQDEEFQRLFDEALNRVSIKKRDFHYMHQLTARDWCEAFVEVWQQKQIKAVK